MWVKASEELLCAFFIKFIYHLVALQRRDKKISCALIFIVWRSEKNHATLCHHSLRNNGILLHTEPPHIFIAPCVSTLC